MELIYSKSYPEVTEYKGKAKLEVDDFAVSKIVPTAYAVQSIIYSTEKAAENLNHKLLKTDVRWREDSQNNYFELNIFYLPPEIKTSRMSLDNMSLDNMSLDNIQSLQPVIMLPYIVQILEIVAAIIIAYLVTSSWNRTVDAVCDPTKKDTCAEKLQKITKPFEIGFAAVFAVAVGVIYLASTGRRAREVI